MINVVVDAMGGDRSPDANVEGAVLAVNKISDANIVLVGDETQINEKLSAYKYDTSRISVLHAADVIDCNEKPTEAIRNKKESSMYKSIELLKSGEDYNALVCTGSTGALLAGAVLKIGRIRGVKRPAFCPILPTVNRKIVGVCDSGANVDCDSFQLMQFAVMGSLYLKKAYGVKNPRVALLNVGTEEEKGDALRKETHRILKETAGINFVGNMESRDLLKGDYDLVVCDGFAGNVLIKSTEGACLEMLKLLKSAMTANFKNKIGAALLKKDIMELKDFMDYNNYGGAVLLGTSKTVVKGHGSSKGITVFHCIEQAYNMEKNGLRAAIAEELSARSQT
ncbi:MAG: phosphate acyltransferase PlsX [Clostridia bacterium]|nr:phosphate acyltransferase PlsX [Clostridia bacterium]